MNMKRILTVGALGFGMALGLQAQDAKPFAAGVSIVTPLDSLKTVTNASGFGGVTADFSYTGMLANSGVPFRASLGIALLPGKEEAGLKVSLLNYQLAGDILTKLGGNENLHLVTGISVNKWRATAEAGGISESENIKGLKFGGRLGLDYRINQQWSANVMLQAIELGAEPNGYFGVNPSWIQVGAKFHF